MRSDETTRRKGWQGRKRGMTTRKELAFSAVHGRLGAVRRLVLGDLQRGIGCMRALTPSLLLSWNSALTLSLRAISWFVESYDRRICYVRLPPFMLVDPSRGVCLLDLRRSLRKRRP